MPDEEKQNLADSGKPLNRREKLLLVFILFIGIGTLGYGAYNLSATIKGPFSSNQSDYDSTLNQSNDLQKMIDLQSADTDNDGLSDYDEIYSYQTSPYLPDTDSDGLTDKQEIENKTDPNCPEGKVCAGTGETGASAEESDDQKIKDFFGTFSGYQANTGDINTNLSEPVMPEITPEYLRSELINSGLTKDEVDKYTDEELMTMFNQSTQGQTSGQTNTNQASTGGQINANLPAGAADMTPDQIRKMLIDAGADQSLINKYSDEDLLKLYQDTVQQSSP